MTQQSLPVRLRQATDNYDLLPVVGFTEWVRRIQLLCNEAANSLEREPVADGEVQSR